MRQSLSLFVLLYLVGCAGTSHQRAPAPATWKKPGTAASAPTPAASVPLHVVRFDLAPSVAERYPGLVAAQVGLGISNRIVEAIYGSEHFSLREEKAEVVQRVAEHLALRGEEAPAPPGVRWWLYGEVVAVDTSVIETVRGLKGETKVTTAVTVQVRLLDTDSGRFRPATTTGRDTRAWRTDLAGAAVAAATEEAVRGAVDQLLEGLGS